MIQVLFQARVYSVNILQSQALYVCMYVHTCAYEREKSDREQVHVQNYFGCPTKNVPTKVKTKPTLLHSYQTILDKTSTQPFPYDVSILHLKKLINMYIF